MTEELTARNTEPFVICRDVRKSFGSNEVLRGISLEVKKGEVVVILGPSARRTQPVSKCNSPVNPGCSILRGQSTLAHSPPSPSQFFTPIANVGANSFKQRSTDRARFRFFDACSCS